MNNVFRQSHKHGSKGLRPFSAGSTRRSFAQCVVASRNIGVCTTHSYRNASVGLTTAALRDGHSEKPIFRVAAARNATRAASRLNTKANSAFWLMNRDKGHESETPATHPRSARTALSEATWRKTSPDVAPRARRVLLTAISAREGQKVFFGREAWLA